MAQVVVLVNGVVKLVDQAGNLWGALNDLLNCGAGRHNLIVGKAQPGDILLYQEQKRASFKMFDYATHVFKYTGNEVITCVVAYDHWGDDTGGEPEIISGGPGHKHVEVQVTSQFCRGFKFTIYVYGKK